MGFIFRNHVKLDPDRVRFSKTDDESRCETVYKAEIESYAEMRIPNEVARGVDEALVKDKLVEALTSEVLGGMVQAEPKMHAASCEPCPFCGFSSGVNHEMIDPEKHHDGCFLKMLHERDYHGYFELFEAWNKRKFL